MSKVIFYTYACNAEKTIARTIESVIAQTCENWLYYCVDNASNDKTGDIIREYAKKDSRIIPLANKQNNVVDDDTRWSTICEKLNDDDCFCVIDADDWYEPRFMEKTLDMINETNADYVACGSNIVNEENRIEQKRTSDESFILEKEELGIRFSETWVLLYATIWAKLFRASVLKSANLLFKGINHGTDDTLFMLTVATQSKKIAFCNDTLHNYFIHSKSATSTVTAKTVPPKQLDYDILYYEKIKALLDYSGTIPKNVDAHAKLIFLNSIDITINKIINIIENTDEKAVRLLEIFSNETLYVILNELSSSNLFDEEKKKIYIKASDVILSKKEFRSTENLETVSNILSVIKIIPEKFEGWSNTEIFELMAKTRKKSESYTLNQQLDAQIISAASQQIFLNGLKAQFLVFFQEIAAAVLNEEFAAALELIVTIIEEETEIPTGLGDELILLGLNLSAELDKAEYFIFLKKVQISFLINSGKKAQAASELSDILAVIPQLADDPDFAEMGNRLS
ncbi:MAG: glycosyltransferase [Oscillospiraceae bacterium]|nr:glycosyltransferase [Oscillospiraceae bacterium]